MTTKYALAVLAVWITAGIALPAAARAAETSPSEASAPPPVAPESAAAEPAALAAVETVERFHALLLDVMRSTAPVEERYARIAPAVRAHFHVPVIARLSLGRSWRALDTAERSVIVERLARVIGATYADRFAEFNEQRFATLATLAGPRGPVVQTQLERRSGAPVRLDYHFREGRIYNVVADGVSDLSLRRADYSGVLKREGIGALLQHLDSQLEALGLRSVAVEPEDDDAHDGT